MADDIAPFPINEIHAGMTLANGMPIDAIHVIVNDVRDIHEWG
jgi:hypothetical protein